MIQKLIQSESVASFVKIMCRPYGNDSKIIRKLILFACPLDTTPGKGQAHFKSNV